MDMHFIQSYWSQDQPYDKLKWKLFTEKLYLISNGPTFPFIYYVFYISSESYFHPLILETILDIFHSMFMTFGITYKLAMIVKKDELEVKYVYKICLKSKPFELFISKEEKNFMNCFLKLIEKECQRIYESKIIIRWKLSNEKEFEINPMNTMYIFYKNSKRIFHDSSSLRIEQSLSSTERLFARRISSRESRRRRF